MDEGTNGHGQKETQNPVVDSTAGGEKVLSNGSEPIPAPHETAISEDHDRAKSFVARKARINGARLKKAPAPADPEAASAEATAPVSHLLAKRTAAKESGAKSPRRKKEPAAATPETTAGEVPAAEPAAAAVASKVEPVPHFVPPLTVFERWAPLFYIGLTTVAEVGFIECYCHWHGAQFLLPNPLKLYSAENINKLINIDFVGGKASVMSSTAEILMWGSLGVWSQRIAGMAKRYREHRPDLPYDLAVYIGMLGCHTSIAAAVMIVLTLSGFKIFNLSLDDFKATVGIAFMLGYFGEHTERLLINMREQLFGKKDRLKKPHDRK